jgi:DNA-binding cell septation regulator SpoVG
MSPFRITGIRFRPASGIDERGGLLGWSSFLLNDAVLLNSVAVRRTRAGDYTLAFPTRRDRQGIEHPIAAPISHDAHRAIEALVLADLRRQGVIQ